MTDQQSRDDATQSQRLSRRNLIRGGGAVAVGAGLAGLPSAAHAGESAAEGAAAATEPGVPVPGWDRVGIIEGTGGGTVPYRAPAGLLDFLDPNEYLHNMEIVSFVPGIQISGGEPLMTMWAEGSRRLIAGGSGFLDVTDPKNPVAVGQGRIPGQKIVVYSDEIDKWLVVTSHQRALTAPNPQYPRGKYHPEYAQTAWDDNGFKGIRVYDASDPENVTLLSEFSTGASGSGTHHNFYDGGRYAYLDCGFDDTLRMESSERVLSNGVMIVDMSDPTKVEEVSRWWVPGQRFDEEEEYNKYPFAGDQTSWTGNHGAMTVPKRVEDGGKVGYGGWGRFGMYVHDLSDIRNPKVYGKFEHPLENAGGIPYHTIYPTVVPPGANPRLRNKVIGVYEGLEPDGREPWHTSYVLDVKNPRNPKLDGIFPRPLPPRDAPYDDFSQSRGRFSAHNCQGWVAPGPMRPEIVALTYFSAGLRLYDISDTTDPKEVAYFVPARIGEDLNDYTTWRRGTSETVFIEWDRNLIWLGTRHGTYCLSSRALGTPVLKPQRVREWSVPHVNRPTL
ncbi:LVIVD repeat-containing protein [Jiangella mangrovi]|uniref:Twin-arginine translocation signal domain-containing protein n=1 Tax=Jiangella mangrovi TaxID=1524084 RepID=A0A7W9GV81_9ACTN|nr:hypothetical protein [Jiangella mangrovi]MBB5790266.1 hypothetical protein [Jiangella mangrovi]